MTARPRSKFHRATLAPLLHPGQVDKRDQGPSKLRQLLADALQRRRLAAGLSQADISSRTGWDLRQSQVSGLLRGALDARLSTWERVAEACGWRLRIVLEPTGEPWWVVKGPRFTMTCPCRWGWTGPAGEVEAQLTPQAVEDPPQPWIVLWTTQGARAPEAVASHVASCKKAQAIFRVEIT